MKCGKPLSDQRKEYCYDCAAGNRSFDQAKAMWVYEKAVKTSVYRFKYRDRREYGKAYAKELALWYGSWIKSRNVQAIVPIPLHKKRKKKRGYNQAEIIANELGRILDLPVRTDILIRARNTLPQKTLNDTERKNNMKKAFKTTENIVQLRCILLVDDIYTTGSTLDAAASVLKEAGVSLAYACCVSIGKDD